MPIFVVTGFPANDEPPEDESIVLPPGAGRRFKGVPFGVTEDTAAVLRTLPYLDEVTDEVAETPPAGPADDPPDPAPAEEEPWEYATDGVSIVTAPPAAEPGPSTGDDPVAEPGPSTEKPPKPVDSDRPSKTKE